MRLLGLPHGKESVMINPESLVLTGRRPPQTAGGSGGRRVKERGAFRRGFGRPVSLISLTAVVLSLAMAGVTVSAENPVKVLRSSSSEVTVEITAPMPLVTPVDGAPEVFLDVPGWSRTYVPGAPDLPVARFQVALPAGMRPVLEVEVLESTSMAGRPAPVATDRIIDRGPQSPPVQEAIRRADEAQYALPYPAAWSELETPAKMRALRVLPVAVYPYRWNPLTRGIDIASRLRLTIRFHREVQGRGPSIPGRERSVTADGRWDRMYREAVINPETVPSALTAPPLRWSGSAMRRTAQEGAECRIEVDRAGMYRIAAADLAALGWPAEVPLSELSLTERFFEETAEDPFREVDVPIRIRDLDGDQLFDGDDDLYFLGRTIWERLRPPARDKRYGRNHVYWLSRRPLGGARMEVGTSLEGSAGPAPETSFVWTSRMEGDGLYLLYRSADESNNLVLGTRNIKVDHFLWFGGFPDPVRLRFDLPGFQQALGLRVALQGYTVPEIARSATVHLAAGRDGDMRPLPGPFTVGMYDDYLYTAGEQELAGLPLQASENYFQIEQELENFGAGVDWLEWTWRRGFAATGDTLAWSTNALTGVRAYEASGFTAAQLLLFEVTDSTAAPDGSTTGPRVLTYEPSQYSGGVLRTRFDAGAGQKPRVFLALAPESAARPLRLSLVDAPDLAAPEGEPEDLLIVTVPEFLPSFQELAEQRRREGFAARIVMIEDVYNQFNGGRAWPTALRNYLRYLFRTRTEPPSFLLLGGEASDDFANVMDASGRNFVPTQTLFSNAFASQPELVSTDEWFVDNLADDSLGADSLDFYPDMSVGRLPVQSEAEAALVVEKILDYGEVRNTDTWRSRGCVVADDEFSGAITFNNPSYHFNGSRPLRQQPPSNDSVFIWSCREVLRMIREEANLPFFAADSFFNYQYMDTVACLSRCRADSIIRIGEDCRAWKTPPRPPDSDPGALGWFTPRDVDIPWTTIDPFDTHTDNYDFGYEYMFRGRPGSPLPGLRDVLSRGHLFVNYQGHANARIMSHEIILIDAPFVRADVPALENQGKPFFFMGYGCHLASHSTTEEVSTGDCIAEKMLLLDRNRGAIASLASTGYEWLSVNHYMNIGLMRAWFVQPPQEDGKARWRLGEILTQGKWQMLDMYGAANPSARGQSQTYNLLGDPTLPIASLSRPEIDLRVNCDAEEFPPTSWEDCEPWQDGQLLVAPAGQDSAIVLARLNTTVISVDDVVVTDNGVELPDSVFTLVPDPVDSLTTAWLRYPVDLDVPLEDHTIKLRVVDTSGRSAEISLLLHLDTRFLVRRDGGLEEIRDDEPFFIEQGDTVTVQIKAPADIDPEQLSLWLEDDPEQPTGFERRLDADAPSGAGREWSISATIPLGLPEARYELAVRMQRWDGETASRSVRIFTGGDPEGPGAVRLLEVYNFPNPFDGTTGFFYRLSGSADRARVRVYTTSGREIWSREGPADINMNVIEWDGRDGDGDEIGNGVYFYKLEVRTGTGKTLSRIEKLARVR